MFHAWESWRQDLGRKWNRCAAKRSVGRVADRIRTPARPEHTLASAPCGGLGAAGAQRGSAGAWDNSTSCNSWPQTFLFTVPNECVLLNGLRSAMARRAAPHTRASANAPSFLARAIQTTHQLARRILTCCRQSPLLADFARRGYAASRPHGTPGTLAQDVRGRCISTVTSMVARRNRQSRSEGDPGRCPSEKLDGVLAVDVNLVDLV